MMYISWLVVISRTMTTVYATSLIAMLVSVQLSIASKYIYLNRLFQKASMNPDEIIPALSDIFVIAKHLFKISQAFLSEGIFQLNQTIVNATNLIFSRYVPAKCSSN